MKPASPLRWYPRAWRERYGDELLALIQDTLAEGQPTWRLRLSVAWGGLRERGRQARHAATAAVKRPTGPDRWTAIIMAGLISPFVSGGLTSSPSARAWQAVALDGLLAVIALTGAVVLADGTPQAGGTPVPSRSALATTGTAPTGAAPTASAATCVAVGVSGSGLSYAELYQAGRWRLASTQNPV